MSPSFQLAGVEYKSPEELADDLAWRARDGVTDHPGQEGHPEAHFEGLDTLSDEVRAAFVEAVVLRVRSHDLQAETDMLLSLEVDWSSEALWDAWLDRWSLGDLPLSGVEGSWLLSKLARALNRHIPPQSPRDLRLQALLRDLDDPHLRLDAAFDRDLTAELISALEVLLDRQEAAPSDVSLVGRALLDLPGELFRLATILSRQSRTLQRPLVAIIKRLRPEWYGEHEGELRDRLRAG